MNVLVLFMQMMFYVGLCDYVTCYLHVNLLSIYAYSLLSIHHTYQYVTFVLSILLIHLRFTH